MARALGITTVAILAVLEGRRRYGLDITSETGLLPGTVYTTLRRLERRSMIRGTWEDPEIAERERRPRRRYYQLTPDGVRALDAARHRLQGLADTAFGVARGEEAEA